MNVYKEFKRQNPGIKAMARTSTPQSNSYAALALAQKAEETASSFSTEGKTEKAIYYYHKASMWYKKTASRQWEKMEAAIKQEAKYLML